MRFTAIAVAFFLAVAFGPRVELGTSDPATITLSTASLSPALGASDLVAATSSADRQRIDVPGTLPASLASMAGSSALMFIAPLGPDTMPVLPDIPAVAEIWEPDPAPFLDTVPPPPLATGLPTALALTSAVPSNGSTLAASGLPQPPPGLAEISGNRLVLRSGPAKRFAAEGVLDRGTPVRITGAREGGYLPVEVAATGASGWVFHTFVRRVN